MEGGTPRFSALGVEDRDRCMDLAERVGWPRETAKWDVFFELGRGFGVRRGDALDAMVMLPSHEGATFVAMMVVDPRAQGRGLGRALLEHALAQANAPAMLYATRAGAPLYTKVGFHEVARVEKHIGTPAVPTEHPRGASARHWVADDSVRIADLVTSDARACGLRRPRMIAALVARSKRIVVDDQGGFALLWSNGHLDVVGPVVAEDETLAIDLVDAALEHVDPGVLARVDVVSTSTRLAAYVAARGLQRLEDAPLMTWPNALHPWERDRYHAIALQGLG
jgi:GNAT superfamily N-acetyltransferase